MSASIESIPIHAPPPIQIHLMSEELSDFISTQTQKVEDLAKKTELILAHLMEARNQIDFLTDQVEKKFMEETCFECPGHEIVVGHFDLEKKAHTKGEEKVQQLRKEPKYKEILYRLAVKNVAEDAEYFEKVNTIKRWINYNFALVVTTYHYDNSNLCPAYQEWLQNREFKSFAAG